VTNEKEQRSSVLLNVEYEGALDSFTNLFDRQHGSKIINTTTFRSVPAPGTQVDSQLRFKNTIFYESFWSEKTALVAIDKF